MIRRYVLLFKKGSFALISVYFAVLFLKPSDLVSISQTSLVITAILARVFLKERLSLGHFVAISLAVVGVILISKPSFIFSSSQETLNCLVVISHDENATTTTTATITSGMNSSTTGFSLPPCKKAAGNDEDESNSLLTVLGICLTFIGAISTSCVFLVLKKLSNSSVHWASSTIFVCWFGLPLSSIISLTLIYFGYSHTDFASERKYMPMDIFYSVLSSMISLIAQVKRLLV